MKQERQVVPLIPKINWYLEVKGEKNECHTASTTFSLERFLKSAMKSNSDGYSTSKRGEVGMEFNIPQRTHC